MVIVDGNIRVDTDRIARKYIEGGQVFIRVSGKDSGIRLIKFLKTQGFAWNQGDCTFGADGFEVKLPIAIDLAEKRVGYMGNVTSAAAAAGSGIVMSDRDFYLLHSLHELLKQG